MDDNGLSRIFGSSESGYTHAFALALSTLPIFRRMFLEKVKEVVPAELQPMLECNFDVEPVVETEFYLGQYGRIDIQMHFSERLVIGIENKRAAPVGHEQLKRYATYYEKLFGSNFLLILLSPSNYVLVPDEIPEQSNFIHVSYASMAEGLAVIISNDTDSSKIGTLYKQLHDYFAIDTFSSNSRLNTSYKRSGAAMPRVKPESWKAPKRNVLGEPFYFNWGLRTTWDEYDAMPQRFGFKTNSTAILDAAALEERTGLTIQSFADYERVRDIDKMRYIVKGKLIKDRNYHPYLCDHVLRRAGSEDFRIKTRNLARKMNGTPLTERILNEMAAKPDVRTRYSTELVPEYQRLEIE